MYISVFMKQKIQKAKKKKVYKKEINPVKCGRVCVFGWSVIFLCGGHLVCFHSHHNLVRELMIGL